MYHRHPNRTPQERVRESGSPGPPVVPCVLRVANIDSTPPRFTNDKCYRLDNPTPTTRPYVTRMDVGLSSRPQAFRFARSVPLRAIFVASGMSLCIHNLIQAGTTPCRYV